MKFVKIPWRWAYFFSLIAFLIAALSITRIVLKTDLTGRVIWCMIWGMIGFAWLTGIVRSRKDRNQQAKGEE